MLSPLLVPCDEPGAVDAAMRSGADALVLDLGDADAPGGRAARRRAAVEALLRQGRAAPPSRPGATPGAPLATGGARVGPSDRGPPLLIVRVAPLASGLADADLDAVMAGGPDAVMLPDAVGARDLQHLAAKLAVREAEHGLSAGRTRVVALAADTAAGALALDSLPGASPRLIALGFDPEALAADLGVDPGASPVRAARDLLLLAAAAAGVPALDCGPPRGGLAGACEAARRDGFSGRLASRAGEVALIARAFSPPGR